MGMRKKHQPRHYSYLKREPWYVRHCPTPEAILALLSALILAIGIYSTCI